MTTTELLATLKKCELISLFTQTLADDQPVPAHSVLLKKRNEDLIAAIASFCDATDSEIVRGDSELVWEIVQKRAFFEHDDDPQTPGAAAAQVEPAPPPATVVHDAEPAPPSAVPPAPPAAAGDSPQPPAAGSKPGNARTDDHADVITVVINKFPGREGSAAYGRRMLFRSGMTVGEFLEAAGDNGRASLRKAIARGWITVTKPA